MPLTEPTELTSWTADAPPPAVRLAGSKRIHAATVIAQRVLFPACGVSIGRPVRRIPIAEADAIDCPACQAVTA